MIEFIIASLAVFGVSALFDYGGPAEVLKKLQKVKWLPFHCVVCTAVWVGLPMIYFFSFIEYLAIIGIVILVERTT